MHTDDKHDPLVDLGYEQRDIDPKNIFKVTMVFFSFTFACYIFGWIFLAQFGYFKDPRGVNNLMSAKIPKDPNPILQTNVSAKTHIKEMRVHEQQALTTAGESETVKGAERIPIEQAIKLSAARGAKLAPSAKIGEPGGAR
jgi:hypothetical protein